MNRRIAGVVVVVVTAMGATLTAAAPATAATGMAASAPALNTFSASTGKDTAFKKSISVDCPSGDKVFGAGGEIDEGNGFVVLDEVVPNLSLTSVSVEAIEHGIYAGVWSLTAWAICAPPVTNMQRISIQSSSTDSSSPKSANATCPAPTKLYGMGAEITNGQGNVVLDDYDIDSGLTRANAGAYEIGSFADSWSIISYAICGDPMPTLTRVAQTSTSNGTPLKTQASDDCPPGPVLYGMGGEISGAQGQALIEYVKPWPSIAPGSLSDIRAVEVDGSSASNPSWNVASYGVGAGSERRARFRPWSLCYRGRG